MRLPPALLLAVLLLSGLANAGSPSLRWHAAGHGDDARGVAVSGLPPAALQALAAVHWSEPQWQSVLRVTAGSVTADANLPAMTGTYRVTADSLRFEPAFPLTPGVSYTAVLMPAALPGDPAADAKPVVATLHIPVPARKATTTIQAVYPTASVLPENLLKFYLHFSAPMSRGHIYEHIHLRDAAGRDIELPFLELDEELWNPAMTRLTLLLDPGRIKRGVRPLEEIGSSLVARRSFTLVVDPAWPDAAGNPLRRGLSRRFAVAAADREGPDPAKWKVGPPRVGSRDALRVDFREPIDHALAERVLQVVGPDGSAVPGQVTVGRHETLWQFAPERPWQPGPHQIRVPTTLEDLAGNNVGKPFDVDLFERVDRMPTSPVVTLPFRPRGKAPTGL